MDLLSLGASATAPADRWRPPTELPDLTNVKRLGGDTETTGKNFLKDIPVGLSFAFRDGNQIRKYYLPFGHSDGNLDPDQVKRWAKDNWAGKHITFSNAKYDVHMCRNWGLDLEALGCQIGDVAFNGALLNDNRRAGLGLDDLGQEYVGMGKVPFDGDLDRMKDYPSWRVGPYAEGDAERALQIEEATLPLITQQGLNRVLSLEESLVPFVCHIERNGCRIDVPKLVQWRKEIREEYHRLSMELYKLSGVLVNPNSGDSILEFLRQLGIRPPEGRTASGKVSFTEAQLSSLKNPHTDKLVILRKLGTLLSNYFDKFYEGLHGDMLYSQFHQLKAVDDEAEGGTKGTISGRFSSSGGGDVSRGYSFNAQQVYSVENQIKFLGDHHIIRELFIPDDGFEFFAGDAAQIEYRLFGHFSNAPKIVQAYKDNPHVSFHKLVMAMVLPFAPDITYKHVKNVNFARLYGAGLRKIALMLGVTEAKAEEYLKQYDRVFPEAADLGKKYVRMVENQGYVSTILGRRARLGPHDKVHSAVNRVIQGTAADIMKMKMLRLYNERKTLGIHKLRQTVHDEQCGDKDPDPKYTALIQECLNVQEVPTGVPIMWDMETGSNWAEPELLKLRAEAA